MAVKVKIPTQLRAATEGEASASVDGATVGEVLDSLYERFGELRDRIAEDGGLRRFVNVYVDGEDIRFLDGLDTVVKDGDEVTILPAVAGGSAPASGGQAAQAATGRRGWLQRVVVEPRRAVALAPQHGEERLVDLELARAAVARVDRVLVVRIPPRVGGDEVADDRPALGIGALVGRAAVKRPAVVDGRSAGGHLDRHELQLGSGWRAVTDVAQPIVGGVETAAHPRMRPPVRPAHVVDRAGVGRRVVEGHPAGGHVGWVQVVQVGRVLVTEQRLARGRLPDRVVLSQAGTRQPGHARGELSDLA